jgi:hypothetical protein
MGHEWSHSREEWGSFLVPQNDSSSGGTIFSVGHLTLAKTQKQEFSETFCCKHLDHCLKLLFIFSFWVQPGSEQNLAFLSKLF